MTCGNDAIRIFCSQATGDKGGKTPGENWMVNHKSSFSTSNEQIGKWVTLIFAVYLQMAYVVDLAMNGRV